MAKQGSPNAGHVACEHRSAKSAELHRNRSGGVGSGAASLETSAAHQGAALLDTNASESSMAHGHGSAMLHEDMQGLGSQRQQEGNDSQPSSGPASRSGSPADDVDSVGAHSHTNASAATAAWVPAADTWQAISTGASSGTSPPAMVAQASDEFAAGTAYDSAAALQAHQRQQQHAGGESAESGEPGGWSATMAAAARAAAGKSGGGAQHVAGAQLRGCAGAGHANGTTAQQQQQQQYSQSDSFLPQIRRNNSGNAGPAVPPPAPAPVGARASGTGTSSGQLLPTVSLRGAQHSPGPPDTPDVGPHAMQTPPNTVASDLAWSDVPMSAGGAHGSAAQRGMALGAEDDGAGTAPGAPVQGVLTVRCATTLHLSMHAQAT